MMWLRFKRASAAKSEPVMHRMVFVTGFARGGTSWLRDCIGSHPDIAVLPIERTVFRDIKDPERIRAYFEEETRSIRNEGRFIVNKAPANAPYVGQAARNFPESKFIFIIRDPRDVLVSHQRGSKAWMKGKNSTVEGCMSKTERYFDGWRKAQGLPNVLLVRYEDLHQNFFVTMARVFDFIGVSADMPILRDVFASNNFAAQTGRAHVEDPDAAKRKGVIGEWTQHLKPSETDWYERSPFFAELSRDYGYDWKTNTYSNIVQAMRTAGVHFLNEEDLLARRLDPARCNVIVQHDIDFLNRSWCFKSVERTAEIEAELGIPSAYNLLPLDDPRYSSSGAAATIELAHRIRAVNPLAYVGLHVNACERFYPADAPDAGRNPPKLAEIRAYLRQQVADYRRAGITFRIATAHGYGRGSRLPNNRDTPEIEHDLQEMGISLFDTTIRRELVTAASHSCAIADVGGILKPRRLVSGLPLTDPRTYSELPGRSILRFLTHPGNYDVDKPSTVAVRLFG